VLGAAAPPSRFVASLNNAQPVRDADRSHRREELHQERSGAR
jgi:hypothetical protein